MEKSPISKEAKIRDTLLISLSGGIIAILGALAEERILSGHHVDLNTVIRAGGSTLFGAGLTVEGAIKHLNLKRSLKNLQE